MNAQRIGFFEEPQLKLPVPKEVAKNFSDADVEKSFDYIFKVLMKNPRIQEEFETKYAASAGYFTKPEFFMKFGQERFEPILNRILHRGKFYPTWINLLRYIINDRIEIQDDERTLLKRMYDRNYTSTRIAFLA